MIRFRLALFNAAAVASSTEETSYYLNGVFCHPHPNGVMLVATDGHILTAIWDKTGFADECAILPLSILNGWKTTKKQAEEVAAWTSSAKMCAVYQSAQWADEAAEMPERKFLVAAIDGTFPDYPRAIPRTLDTTKVQPQPFSGELLTRIAKIASLWSVANKLAKSPGLTVAGEAGKASIVTLTGGNETGASAVHIVIMPMASKDMMLASPEWALAGLPADCTKAA